MRHTSSVFYLSDYSIRRPISSILQFFSDLKCCLDRIRKGYCKKDLWEIDTWFLNVMPEMLEEFNRCKNSYPRTFLEQYIQKHEKELSVSKEKFIIPDANESPDLYEKFFISIAREFPELYKKIEEEAYEAWGSTLLEMADLMRKGWCDGWKLKDGWEDRIQCQKKALEMFQTYFNDLWD